LRQVIGEEFRRPKRIAKLNPAIGKSYLKFRPGTLVLGKRVTVDDTRREE
jgi:hypothetical protein